MPKVEEAIAQLKETHRYDWESWDHTLARGERLCWSMYAHILASHETQKAIDALEAMVVKLEALASHTVEEVAILLEDSYSGKPENGFRGVEEKSIPNHPGYIRLTRVLSASYNALGYGYVTLGWLRDAIRCYGKALRHLGETGVIAHRANILNNLSRALSYMGRERAARVCRDVLELRPGTGGASIHCPALLSTSRPGAVEWSNVRHS